MDAISTAALKMLQFPSVWHPDFRFGRLKTVLAGRHVLDGLTTAESVFNRLSYCALFNFRRAAFVRLEPFRSHRGT
jgi:hypothetical protein